MSLEQHVGAAGLSSHCTQVCDVLREEHGIETWDDLVFLVSYPDGRQALQQSMKTLWWMRLVKAATGDVGAVGGAVAADDNPVSVIEDSRGTALNPYVIIINPRLQHGAGLAGAISRAGGPQIQRDSTSWVESNNNAPLGNGQCVLMSGHDLPAKYVLHTVGPRVMDRPTPKDERDLAAAVRNSLAIASNAHVTSIAIPCISTGIFGFPVRLACSIIVRACREYCQGVGKTSLRSIVLMDMDQGKVDVLRQTLRGTVPLPPTLAPGGFLPASRPPQRESEGTITKDGVKAAGVIVVRRSECGVELLLSVEVRENKVKGGRKRPWHSKGYRTLSSFSACLHVLGGQAEGRDRHHPEETAAREFWEETGGFLPRGEVEGIVRDAPSVYIPSAKYRLYVVEATPEAHDLPSLFRSNKGMNFEVMHIGWVSLSSLLRSLEDRGSKTVSADIGTTRPREYLPGDFLGKVLATSEALSLLRSVAEACTPHADGSEERVREELARVDSLLSLSDSEFVAQMHGEHWPLSLKAPPLPPRPSVHSVPNSDPFYKRVMVLLPASIQGRVYAIRTATVAARKNLYDLEKKALGVKERALFHGTKEPWRATQIALNGFDLSIAINGRSLGNGVYTATDPNTGVQYAGGKGSLLVLLGLLSEDITPQSGNGVFVYTKPDQLLCVAIVDFGDDDSDTAALEAAAIEEAREREREMAALEVEMREREAAHESEIAAAWRPKLSKYRDTLSETAGELAGDGLSPERRETLTRCVASEKSQLDSHLPIYLHKEQVVEALGEKDVLFLSAPTGTGKSTQLPQYLVDDLFPEDTRRVAVLQPRRVICTALSARVSYERGGVVGGEVGYSMGGGAVEVSEQTRIEYMTHGLFASMSLQSDLRSKYCAVVLDEAHERTIEVDMSLALLTKALGTGGDETMDGEGVLPFKVVVCSATLGDEVVDTLREYVDPTDARSSVLSLPSHSFPVHVLYRDQGLLQEEDGTVKNGSVLTSASVEEAIQLYQQTTHGNILVFLPGKAHLMSAFECFRRHLDTGPGWLHSPSGHCMRLRVKDETLGVFMFHGGLSTSQREEVLDYKKHGFDRTITFSTNVAETGLTIPNCRYVVDSGLERVVHWNPDLGSTDMRSALASRSSLEQRKGRAGRTASGVCIRLYSKEVFEAAAETRPPGVTAKNVQRVLLRLLHERQNGESITLPHGIPPEMESEALATLMGLGAVAEDASVTKEGEAMMSLGVDLRQAAFLLACNNLGCLMSGARIVAMATLSTSVMHMLPKRPDPPAKGSAQPDATPQTESSPAKTLYHSVRDKVLPSKAPVTASEDIKHPFHEYVDSSGDHMTLLNIYTGYTDAKSGASWCMVRGVPMETMLAAESNLDSVLERLGARGCTLKDDPERFEESGGIRGAIRRALCVGYFDQLAVVKVPFQLDQGIARLLPTEQVGTQCDALYRFAKEVGPKSATVLPPAPTPNGEVPEMRIRLESRSALHVCQAVAEEKDEDPGEGSMLVFHSQMVVDSSSLPSVQLASYVSQSDLASLDPAMRKVVEVNMRRMKCIVERVPLSGDQRTAVIQHMGVWMKQLRRMHPSAGIRLEGGRGNSVLVIAAPESTFDHVMDKVHRRLATAETEDVYVRLPRNLKPNKVKGKMQPLRSALGQLLRDTGCAGRFNITVAHSTQAVPESGTEDSVKITVGGEAKCQLAALVGRVNSFLAGLAGAPFRFSVLGSGQEGRAVLSNPRYQRLA
ncbi:hypothetical protein KIPB_008247, partial [Kipferlia bialata]|eukprot:g8247.t1